jgi:conjugative transfer signal peptidase TraF
VKRKGFIPLIAIPLATCLVVTGAWAVGIRINTTPSMPRGAYYERMSPAGATLHRGDVVIACVTWAKGDVAPYIGGGVCQDTGLEPVLKPVAAIPGDDIDMTRDGIVVNGVLLPHSARLAKDGQGRILPQPLLTDQQSIVPHGYVWLIAPMDKSLDSRYLGPFKVSQIVGVMRPLLVE